MSTFDEMDAFDGASLSSRAMAARPTPYLDGLNPAQREAVECLHGPVLMLAGAGTGKTKALTARIVHLLNTGSARTNEILAVTFTNKAAREMKERVGGMLGQPAEGMPWLGTFHSVCVKLLRRHAELICGEAGVGSDAVIDDARDSESPNPYEDLGPSAARRRHSTVHLKSNFTILDTDDQIRLLKQLIRAAGIDEKRWPPRMLAGIIDDWKNRALTPEKLPASEAGAYNHRGPELYAQYQRRLLELNAVDFGDLLLHVVTIFQTHSDGRGEIIRQLTRDPPELDATAQCGIVGSKSGHTSLRKIHHHCNRQRDSRLTDKLIFLLLALCVRLVVCHHGSTYSWARYPFSPPS